MVRHLRRGGGLETDNHYALHVLLCSTTNLTHSVPSKSIQNGYLRSAVQFGTFFLYGQKVGLAHPEYQYRGTGDIDG